MNDRLDKIIELLEQLNNKFDETLMLICEGEMVPLETPDPDRSAN